jgi:hypothetical protein
MSKCDFYIGSEWLGSLLKNGDVWHIPLEILIQESQVLFEELVIEHLEKNNGIIKDNGHKWPHNWEDSLMTDYNYIFNLEKEEVYMHQMGVEFLIRPIKILQGYSLTNSFTQIQNIKFPKMTKEGDI